MTLKIEELPDEAIIVCTINLPHVPAEDVRDTLQATASFKEKLGKKVYRIVDLSLFELSFSEAVMGMGAEKDAPGGINDPDVSTIYVGSGEWVTFGVKAFQEQEQYGETHILAICNTVDEALSAARADIAKAM